VAKKVLNRSDKISLLKGRGKAQEMKGRGIYSFSLDENPIMVFLGKTWDEAILCATRKGWFRQYEVPCLNYPIKIHM
jgi:hypothetical protein